MSSTQVTHRVDELLRTGMDPGHAIAQASQEAHPTASTTARCPKHGLPAGHCFHCTHQV